MPISTDSQAWKNAEEEDTLTQEVLEFLHKHPDEAFRLGEILDELYDTHFMALDENDRLREELGEDEYQEKKNEDVPTLPYGEEDLYNYTKLRINDLVLEGIIDARTVSAEYFDAPPAMEETSFYSINIGR